MSSDQPSAKRQKFSLASMQVTTVKVLVGENETPFSIYKHHICAESRFFEVACKDYWACGQEGVIRLVNDDPKLFGIFVTWLLTKDIEQAEDLVEVIKTDAEACPSSFYARSNQLLRLFVLAKTLQAENFQNAVMDSVLATSDQFSTETRWALGSMITDIKYAYENTLLGSPLRQAILDSNLKLDNYSSQTSRIFNQLNSDSGMKYSNKWAQDYLSELLNAVANRIGEYFFPWERDRCVYHEHRDKPGNYSCTQKTP